MRNYLKKINIIGCVMVYQEGDVCRWSLDWLVKNCNEVIVLLDNYNSYTENIILEYKKKYPNKINMIYSTVPIDKNRNSGSYIKQRFKNYQANIREQVAIELRKMHKKKEIELVVWMDSVTGDTPILIEQDGIIDFIEIQELLPKSMRKKQTLNYYNKVNNKISILTKNGFKKINYIKQHKVNKPIYHIAGEGVCRVTSDHSLFINNKQKKGSDIEIKDKLDRIKFIDKNNFESITEDFAMLLGFFVAEGHASFLKYPNGKIKQYNWNLAECNKEKLKKYGEIMKAYYGSDYYFIKDDNKNKINKAWNITYRLWIKNPKKPCLDFLNWCYSDSKKKKVPKNILNGSKKIIKAFLKGYYEGDGHKRRGKQWLSDTNSFLLAAGIVYILTKINIKFTPYIRKNKLNIIRIMELLTKNGKHKNKKEGVRKIIKEENFNDYVYDIGTEDGTFVGGVGNILFKNSDETFLDCFPEYLEKFWKQTKYSYMMTGFVEVYDRFDIIISQRMAPHSRVFKFTPEFSCIPKRSRTIQNPYYYSKPYVIRHMIVHMCNFTEEYRKKREEVTGRNMMTELKRYVWMLPKDVRKMRPEEIAKYQPNPKGVPAEIKPILLQDYK